MSERSSDRAHGFAERVIDWQRAHGRHDLPWQGSRDAYRVWLSEIMLQQTQVATVIPYFERFLAAFPDVGVLADASLDEVLGLWSGLGYYSRARNLHACARRVVEVYDGRFPDSREALEALPGIGRSTAAAIAVFAHGRREAILDGNVKRVLARVFMLADAAESVRGAKAFWRCAESLLPHADGMRAYTQGMMDIGATVCTRTRPACSRCPLASDCGARLEDRIADFPVRKRRAVLPQRSVQVLASVRLVSSGYEVWLERRPPAGIWGALWSLPERAISPGRSPDAPRKASSTRSGLPELEPIDHVFTHFRLRIEPAVEWAAVDLDRVDGCGERIGVADPGQGNWVKLPPPAHTPLPRPIRTLLERLAVGLAQAAGRPA